MPIPKMSLVLKDLVATNPRPGSVIELTDVTTCAPDSSPSATTVADFWVGATKDQISSATAITVPGPKNVAMLSPGASYTRAAGSRSLTIPSAVTPGARFVIARLRLYPSAIFSFAITINP